MEKYLFKLSNSISKDFLGSLEPAIFSHFSTGVGINDLESVANELLLLAPEHFYKLLFLIKNSFIHLEYRRDNDLIELTSPQLVSFIITPLKKTQNSIVKEFHLHEEALMSKVNNKTRILNPYINSSLVFTQSLNSLLEILREDRFFSNLVEESNLLTSQNKAMEDDYSLMDEVFHFKTHEMNNHKYDTVKLLELMKATPSSLSGKKIKITDLQELNLTEAIFERSSKRTPSAHLNMHSLISLLELIFSETQNHKRIYPSAGAIYNIYPIVHIYDQSIGLPEGTYKYIGGQTSLEPMGPLGHPPYQTQEFSPRCCISLISDPTLSLFKYGPLSFKLSILNAGALLPYLYIFSSALKLHGCAWGAQTTREKLLPGHHKDLASFCLY